MTKELTFNTVTTFKNMRIGMVFTSKGGGLYMRLPVITSNHGRKFNAIYFPVLDERDTSIVLTWQFQNLEKLNRYIWLRDLFVKMFPYWN